MGVSQPQVLVHHEAPPRPSLWRRIYLGRRSVKGLEKYNQALMARKAAIVERQRQVNALITEKKNG